MRAFKKIRTLNFLFFTFLSLLSISAYSQTCEKTAFKNNLSLNALSSSGLKIEWLPVANASHYEIKYIVRIPDGKTLVQSEITETGTSHTFPENEFPHANLLQLVLEITAHCDGTKSASSFGQFALINQRDGCQFKNTALVLEDGKVSWDPVAKAQSYLMCFFSEKHEVACKETSSIKNDVALGSANFMAVTPICNASPGTTVFVPIVRR